MKSQEFYLIEYEPGNIGCPHYLSGEFNDSESEFEWETYTPDPRSVKIEKEYEFNVTDRTLKDLSFDYYRAPTPIVSGEFLDVCRCLNVEFREVPLKITIRKKTWDKKQYYLFLPCAQLALLDRENSEFQEELVIETGEVMLNKNFPNQPIYACIKHFHVRPVDSHLFLCLDLLELVVSAQFKQEASARGLQGLRFVPIDDTFKYNPWGDI